MNKDLMLRVADQIEREPEKFDMGDWATKKPCGTAACVAGTALMIHYGKRIEISFDERGYAHYWLDGIGISAWVEAENILDVDSGGLFFDDDWPPHIQDEVAFGRLTEAQAAVKLIREMVEKG